MTDDPEFARLMQDADRGTAREFPFRQDVALNIPPDFYEAVGMLSKQWSDVEFFCRSVLSAVTKVEPLTMLILTSGMQTRSLLETTQRAIHHFLPNFKNEYDATHKRLLAAHLYRNQIMHGNHLGPLFPGDTGQTVEWKVRLNKQGLSFHRAYALAAHKVRRRALLNRLLALKLLDIESQVRHLVEARSRINPAPLAPLGSLLGR